MNAADGTLLLICCLINSYQLGSFWSVLFITQYNVQACEIVFNFLKLKQLIMKIRKIFNNYTIGILD